MNNNNNNSHPNMSLKSSKTSISLCYDSGRHQQGDGFSRWSSQWGVTCEWSRESSVWKFSCRCLCSGVNVIYGNFKHVLFLSYRFELSPL